MERRRIELEGSSQRELELPPPRRRVALDDERTITLRVPNEVADAVVNHTEDAVRFLVNAAAAGTTTITLFDDALWKDKLKGLTPSDQAELIRFRAFLQDSKKMCPPDLIRKHGDYMGLMPAEIEGLLSEQALKIDDSFVWWSIGYTPWNRKERPPSSGYWQVKQHSARGFSQHDEAGMDHGRVLAHNAQWLRMWYAPGIDKWYKSPTMNGGHASSKDAQPIPHEVLMQSHEWRGLVDQSPDGYGYELEQTRPIVTLKVPGVLTGLPCPYTNGYKAPRRRVEV